MPSGRSAKVVLGLVAIDKRVHLLGDDIRSFAGGALIKLDALKQRNPDLVHRVALHQNAGAFLDIGQRPRLRAKQILKAF